MASKPMASIGSTSGHQEGELPDAPSDERWHLERGKASLPRCFPLVEPMLAIGLLLIGLLAIGLLAIGLLAIGLLLVRDLL